METMKTYRIGGNRMKLIKWFLKTIGMITLTCIITLSITHVIVQHYIQCFLSSMNIKWQEKPLSWNGVIQNIWGSPVSQSQYGHESENNKKISEFNLSQMKKDEMTVMGNADSKTNSLSSVEETIKRKIVVTPEQIAAKKNEISVEDKKKILQILITKLPPSEIQNISEKVENGITKEDLLHIKNKLSKYLMKEEYNQIVKILTPTNHKENEN